MVSSFGLTNPFFKTLLCCFGLGLVWFGFKGLGLVWARWPYAAV